MIQPPTTNHQLTTTNHQPPTTNHQPPTNNQQPLTTNQLIMSKDWPPPNIKPLTRIQVSDGMLINSARWQMAHEYHRIRQNIHYQSLNQPGIVSDLGVYAIEPPPEVTQQYRDRRWVKIQPGIAIDLFGNVIVVNEPVSFRITSEAKQQPTTIYLVVSYVDPNQLQGTETNNDFVTETFRIDERNSPPTDLDVEICRIQLQPGEVQISNPTDVFYPQLNELDLRYRQKARSRSQGIVRVGVVTDNNPNLEKQLRDFSYLLQSLDALYPALQGAEEIGQVSLQLNPEEEEQKQFNYDLIYFKYKESRPLKAEQLASLKNYLNSGSVLFIEAAIKDTKIEDLIAVKKQLQEALGNLGSLDAADLQKFKQDINKELQAVDKELEKEVKQLSIAFEDFAKQLGTPLTAIDQFPQPHPLRTQPFLFSQLPEIDHNPISIMVGGGIVIVIGNLLAACGLDDRYSVSRETLRTAQEMGINILHYAWRRRQITYLE
ncbi:DUF4159 domain-containing protein [Planktothricoides raciborskii]|uniref:DUF4159 domain-containing protein n=2 Tax=Planktothricoides raciborskii TaxID=132608 RepID=A0AAU8JJE8_9CYAN